MVHCEAVPTGINWFDENKWGSHFLRWPTLLLTLWVISQGCLRRRGDDSTLAFPPHMQDMLMIDGVKPKHIFTYIHKCVCIQYVYTNHIKSYYVHTISVYIYICIYNIRIISYRIIVIVHVRHMSDMSYRPQAFQTPMWLTSRFCKWSCKVREVWGVWLRNQLWLY
jgi:hypothetical protein